MLPAKASLHPNLKQTRPQPSTTAAESGERGLARHMERLMALKLARQMAWQTRSLMERVPQLVR